MDFRQIHYFICLYEEGSVTRAAQRLHIVQSALSMQMGKLEAEVGQKLFTRTPQGMVPTDEGRRLHRLFSPVISDFQRALGQVVEPTGELTGHVRMGTIVTISQGILVDALMEFSAAHPKVEISITDGLSANLIDAVASRQLDAAVINKPRRTMTLHSEAFFEEDLLLVTGPAHPGFPPDFRFADLAGLRMVLPTRQHGLRAIIDSFAQAEDVDLRPVLEIDAISAILKLVAEGDFCTLLPSIAVRGPMERGGLKAHRFASPRLRRQLVVVTNPARPLGPAASVLLAMLRRQIVGLSASLESSPA